MKPSGREPNWSSGVCQVVPDDSSLALEFGTAQEGTKVAAFALRRPDEPLDAT